MIMNEMGRKEFHGGSDQFAWGVIGIIISLILIVSVIMPEGSFWMLVPLFLYWGIFAISIWSKSEQKRVRLEYLISKYVIDSANIVLVDNNFNNAINLYKIK